jgi:diguanylate cyclase (GGDEF)-like protein
LQTNGLSAQALLDDETSRQRGLDAYEILDTPEEKCFDDIAKLAAAICGTPTAMVTFIDRDRQWFKAKYGPQLLGPQLTELPRSAAFCDYAIRQPEAVTVVPDTRADARFAEHMFVATGPKLRFYAAAPLVMPSGGAVGTVAVIDRQPRQLNAEQIAGLDMLARQVVALLEMRRTIIGLSDANARLAQRSLTDAQTGIGNRRAYNQEINAEFARARRTGTPLSLLLVNISTQEQNNDTLDDTLADAALTDISKTLQNCLRPYDFLARYASDEFAIILPNTDIEHALIVAERIRSRVTALESNRLSIIISIGVARLDAEANIENLVRAADNGLYLAKASGRNNVVVGKLPSDFNER